jgi:SecD/SecF fusion protein
MKKTPILSRTILAVIVIAIFAWSIFPIQQRDFYGVFRKLAVKKDEKIDKLISLAEQKQKDKGIFAQVALDEAATDLNMDLTEYVPVKGATGNRDVISFVREKSSGSIRLGLDLNGGAEFFLLLNPKKQDDTEEGKKRKLEIEENFNSYRDAAIEILRNRLETQKIYETEISPVGEKYISLKVPTVSKEEKLKLLNLIKMSASLHFRLVHKDNEELISQYLANPEKFKVPSEYELMSTAEIAEGKKPVKKFYVVKIRAEMTGKGIVNAGPRTDQYGQRYIFLSFNGDGTRAFGKITRDNVNRQLAIVLDGKLYSAPAIKDAIEGGEAQITGNFSMEEAQNISNALISGSLPIDLDVEGIFDTDPTLGRESVKTGAIASFCALIAIMVFMLAYYRLAGIVANIALLVNMVLILGAMSAFNATLTLPGIAGIILTIGMAVDANILILERIREELRKNKTLPNAIDLGFSRAFLTIFDSNLTTIFIALVLLWLGSGALKGFAVTLTIGIITSMFTALFISRLVFDLILKYAGIKTLKMASFFPETGFDFLKYRYLTAVVSAALIVVSIVAFSIRGKDCLGIDFRGGTRVTFNFAERVAEDKIAKTLEVNGFASPKVSYKVNMIDKDAKQLEIILGEKDVSENTGIKEKIEGILNSAYPALSPRGGDDVSIGGLIGWEFTKMSIFALFISIVGMIIYISLRFEFAYGIAGIVALVHDVLIAAGVYVLFGGELSLTVLAALLTILGYSINDTIVIFDRIREDIGLMKNKTYDELINLSVNQTLNRTVLTATTTLIAVLFLFMIQDASVKAFAFAMTIGIVVGTYSSVYIASALISIWHKPLRGEKGKNN